MKGGKVIGAGTFGCVFNPPLKCKDNKDKDYQVSKLLKLKDLHEEVDQTDKIHEHISKSSLKDTYTDYCIVPSSNDVCSIDMNNRDNKKELINAERTCNHIYTNYRTVKHRPRKFKSLNMLDGGIDIRDFLENQIDLNISTSNLIINEVEIENAVMVVKSCIEFFLEDQDCSIPKYSIIIDPPNFVKALDKVIITIHIRGQSKQKIKEIVKLININTKSELEQLISNKYGRSILITEIDIQKNKMAYLTPTEFKQLNTQLIALLEHGIHKLNSIDIYHCDLKDLNIVYNLNDNKLRLIDWGLAFIDNKAMKPLFNVNERTNPTQSPVFKMGGIIYYGLPFSNIMMFSDWDSLNIEDIMSKINYNYLHALKEFTKNLYNKETITLHRIIKKSIEKIKAKYDKIKQKSGVHKKIDFFRRIFLKNCDIFAFLLIYIKLFDKLSPKNKWSLAVRYNIVKLIKKYILTDYFATRPYNIPDILDSLRRIDMVEKDNMSNLDKSLNLKNLNKTFGFKDENDIKIAFAAKGDLQQIFNMYDTDQSGEIDVNELKSALHMIGINVDNDELYHLMDRIDTDGNGGISYEEFVNFVNPSQAENRYKLHSKKVDCFGEYLQKIPSNKQYCYICKSLGINKLLSSGNRHQCRLCRNVVCNKHSNYKLTSTLHSSPKSKYNEDIKKQLNFCRLHKIRICKPEYQEMCLTYINTQESFHHSTNHSNRGRVWDRFSRKISKSKPNTKKTKAGKMHQSKKQQKKQKKTFKYVKL